MRFALIPTILAGFAAALPRVTRTGKYLYDESGDRFFIKGIAYQVAGTLGVPENPGDFPEPIDFVDSLANPAACTRDIPNLQTLTVNTIRVYSVDATLDHSSCMQALDAAGIYTFIDLSLPVNGSITRLEPAWTTNLLDLYLSTIDTFLQYDNVLGFNIGNEVVVDAESSVAAAFIKAAARDVKAYLRSKGSSALVGYASTDGAGWRDPLAHYLTCESEETSIDIWGINNYRWCGSSGSVSGSYGESLTSFADLPIPAYLSEYGCDDERPRPWTEVPAIFGDEEMAAVYSGGIAFSYFPTNDDFGITTLDGDTISTTEEFDLLAAQLSAITTFPTTPAQSGATTLPLPACPATGGDFLAGAALPPTPNKRECDCTWTSSPCVFSPQTDDHAALFEELFQTACTLLGEAGGSCDSISANGATGVYGPYSMCDGATKITHVFSEFYFATNNNPQSCNFAGNASIQDSGVTTAAELRSDAEACFATDPDVFTPSAPTETPHINTPSSTRTGSGSSPTAGNGASSLTASKELLVGMGAAVLFSIAAFSLL